MRFYSIIKLELSLIEIQFFQNTSHQALLVGWGRSAFNIFFETRLIARPTLASLHSSNFIFWYGSHDVLFYRKYFSAIKGFILRAIREKGKGRGVNYDIINLYLTNFYI